MTGRIVKFALISWAFPAILLSSAQAQAAASAGALVEEIDDGVGNVAAFDTLKSGQNIDLRPNHHAIISYLDSCIRETITGGTVKIGTSQSDVQDGTVQRETVDCSLKQLTLTANTQDQSATTVFRPLFDNLVKQTLPDVSPFILAEQAASIEMKQMGKEDAPVKLTLRQGKIDLRTAGIRLQPGGIYKLTAGSRETYIKITPDAKAGEASLLMRIVKL
jgi:hypothetical protein